jgi:hypothetical protein
MLGKLAVLIADGGGLALVNPRKRCPQESWEPVADQIVAKFLGSRTRHPKSKPQGPENEPALVRSECFSNFTAHEFPSTITRDINSIVGSVYSTSSSVRPLFGDNAKAFGGTNESAAQPESGWVFNGQVETEVVIAPKRAQ